MEHDQSSISTKLELRLVNRICSSKQIMDLTAFKVKNIFLKWKKYPLWYWNSEHCRVELGKLGKKIVIKTNSNFENSPKQIISICQLALTFSNVNGIFLKATISLSFLNSEHFSEREWSKNKLHSRKINNILFLKS